MLEKVRQNPVVVVALVQAVLVLLVSFGFKISEDQIQAILTVVAAGIAATAIWTRGKTRSQRSLDLEAESYDP